MSPPVCLRVPRPRRLAVGGYAYGLTERGGDSQAGALFRIREDGHDFSVAHSFGGATEDGKRPFGSLVALDDFLYGTTTEGGTSDVGTVSRYRPSDGLYEVLASFETATTGALPEDDLVPNADGSVLCGMTQAGGVHDPDGEHGYGAVFAIGVPRCRPRPSLGPRDASPTAATGTS